MQGNQVSWYYDGLRRLLGDALNVPVWVELAFGRSFRCKRDNDLLRSISQEYLSDVMSTGRCRDNRSRCFRGLDMYLKPHLYGAPHVDEVAWYVLYQDTQHPDQRIAPAPEDFWRLNTMVSMGQFEQLGDWLIAMPHAMVTQ